jgi:hypothetical protein
MQVVRIGLDLAKYVFAVHGVDARGKIVLRKTLRRDSVSRFFANFALFMLAGCPLQTLSTYLLVHGAWHTGKELESVAIRSCRIPDSPALCVSSASRLQSVCHRVQPRSPNQRTAT